MVNNYDWTASLSTIDFLRDIGKHFPVNRMLARDTVRTRLESGISYTEFSYVLLQSMDYLNLHRDHGVTLQFGGSDQWGNITGGVELIRRADGDTRARLRDAADHQGRRHEVRQDRGRRPVARPGDAVAVRLLPVLAQRRGREGRRAAAGLHVPLATRRSRSSRRRPPRSRSCGPGQKALAEHMTIDGARRGPRPRRSRRPPRPCSVAGRCASSTARRWPRRCGRPAAPRSRPPTGMPAIVDLFVATGLSKSKGDARRTVGEGGAYLNNERVDRPRPRAHRGRPARRLLAGAAARQEEPRRRGGRGVTSRAVRRRARGARGRDCSPSRSTATSARAPATASSAAEAAGGLGPAPLPPPGAARRHRRRPPDDGPGHRAALAVRRRAHRDAARRAPRGRGGMAAGVAAAGSLWWSRATPARPSRTIGATGVAVVARRPT